MAAASSSVNRENIDYYAEDYVIAGNDEKLKALADRVSVAFLNREFYSICYIKLNSSIETIITKNRNFASIDDDRLIDSVKRLVFNKQKKFIRIIATQQTEKGDINNLLRLFKEAREMAECNNEDNGYQDMLDWLKLLPGLAYADALKEESPERLMEKVMELAENDFGFDEDDYRRSLLPGLAYAAVSREENSLTGLLKNCKIM